MAIDLEADARTRLDPVAYAYVSGGAGDTVAANVSAWGRYRLRPMMLRDVSTVSTTVTMLGRPAEVPIVIAPTAMHRLVHPEGELDTARGAAAAGVTYCVSMAATTSFADVAAVAPDGPRWMQVYVRNDRGITRAVCEQAVELGYTATVVTVDAPVVRSNRPPLGRPLNAGLPLPNLAPGDLDADVFDVASDYATDLTFEELADIRAWTGLPLVVKGVLRGDDALRCVEAGADGVGVSNHGGRQIPGCMPTAVALDEICTVLDGRGEVYVDGGVRSGADVLKALALGARGVMVGRPVIWALACGGAAGVTDVLGELRLELERVMGLCGLRDLSDIPRDLVAEWHAGGDVAGGPAFGTGAVLSQVSGRA